METRSTVEWIGINRTDARYPSMLTDRLGDRAPSTIATIGKPEILSHPRLGLICSIRCPGGIVIKTFDAIRELRDAGVVVAGGFHSPMEKECLDFLLLGEQPVIVCPAKGLAPPSAGFVENCHRRGSAVAVVALRRDRNPD